MSDIFISYASEDLERIQPFIQVLERKGWSVWWDRKIPPGRTFDEVIEEAVDSASCMIVVWSEKSVSSRWVRNEAGEGERRGILIPVLIDDVKIPLAFRRIEAAQLVGWDGVSDHPEFDILLESAAKLIGRPPAVEPDRPSSEKAGTKRLVAEQVDTYSIASEKGLAVEKAEAERVATEIDELDRILAKSRKELWRRIPVWGWIVGGLVALLITIGLIVGSAGRSNKVIVQIWDVEQDEKHTIVASQQFTIFGNILLEDELEQVGGWFVEQVVQKYELNTEELQIHLYVPADLSNEEINLETIPSGPNQVSLWIVDEGDDDGDGGKSRVPLQSLNMNEQALAQLGKNFYLEISRPGYENKVIEVTWGQELYEDFTLLSIPVRVGIEEFEGEQNSIAMQLMDYLTNNPRFSISDPDTLDALKRRIAEEEAYIKEHPWIQYEIRTSLGVDLIVSGRYEEP